MVMKPAAIGVRVHSGWGALVGVAGEPGAEEIVERTRVEIVDAKIPGVSQPYHFAERLCASKSLSEAQAHIDQCAAASGSLALSAIQQVVKRTEDRGFHVIGAVVLLSSARPLPEFAKVLASHALIHTAEGEFFRTAFREAFRQLEIPVTGIPERDLEEHANAAFGKRADSVHQKVSEFGRSLGPPWTQDQKSATLAAMLLLANHLAGIKTEHRN
jgi:hypothetical protein